MKFFLQAVFGQVGMAINTLGISGINMGGLGAYVPTSYLMNVINAQGLKGLELYYGNDPATYAHLYA